MLHSSATIGHPRHEFKPMLPTPEPSLPARSSALPIDVSDASRVVTLHLRTLVFPPSHSPNTMPRPTAKSPKIDTQTLLLPTSHSWAKQHGDQSASSNKPPKRKALDLLQSADHEKSVFPTNLKTSKSSMLRFRPDSLIRSANSATSHFCSSQHCAYRRVNRSSSFRTEKE